MNIPAHPLRRLFPVAGEQIFFNHAAIAPPSSRAIAAMAAFNQECATEASRHYNRWQRQLSRVRAQAAALVGGAPEDMALVPNTSSGLSLVAESLPWQPGDAILVPVPDYPANVYPWENLRRRGVEIVWVRREVDGRIDTALLEQALTPRVRLLALSSVDFASGFRADLDAIGAWCRQQGLLLVVDAIQSLGVIPVNVTSAGIHALACGAHKWLLGPMGIGLLYLAPELRARLQPSLVGWKSVEDEENFTLHFQLRSDAAVFEPGTLNWSGIFGLSAALELLEEVGAREIRQRVLALTAELATGLATRGLHLGSPHATREHAGILCFAAPGDAQALWRALLREGVALSLRAGQLRLAPHFYNDSGDVAAFFAALERCL